MGYFSWLPLVVLYNTGSNIVYNMFNDGPKSEISCEDFNTGFIGTLHYIARPHDEIKFKVYFTLETDLKREPIKVSKSDWNTFENSAFDPAKETYLIVHGYKSSGEQNWVIGIKNAILKANKHNVIIIDWSEGSQTWNYVEAARNTAVAAKQIYELLHEMRNHVKKLRRSTSHKMNWNNISIVGHSLGAQISGQVAQLLKKDWFFVIKRITGLDPAGPCFRNVPSNLRLDKDDADYVDVFHTQADGGYFSLGLNELLGDSDFFFNGGIRQPECKTHIFSWEGLTLDWKGMKCSHGLSSQYFIESIRSSIDFSDCQFVPHPWDETYEQAKKILDDFRKSSSVSGCINCLQLMGLNPKKHYTQRAFLVITSTTSPYCKFESEDYNEIEEVIELLK